MNTCVGHRLFVGVDSGGTTTRAVLVDESLEVVAVSATKGANRWSSGCDSTWSIITGLIENLVPNEHRRCVEAIVVGVSSSIEEASPSFQSIGIDVEPLVVQDFEIAYASGSQEPSGLLMIAGTGAGCFAFDDWVCVRQVDGHGWLFGDYGSAVWIGRSAIEAALRALDGIGPATHLVGYLQELVGFSSGLSPTEQCAAIVTHFVSLPPADLGALAPTVVQMSAFDEGSSLIVNHAVEHLVHSVLKGMQHLMELGVVWSHELVTCGSVAGDEQLRNRLSQVFHGHGIQVHHVDNGLVGAVLWAAHGRQSNFGDQLRHRLRKSIAGYSSVRP